MDDDPVRTEKGRSACVADIKSAIIKAKCPSSAVILTPALFQFPDFLMASATSGDIVFIMFS